MNVESSAVASPASPASTTLFDGNIDEQIPDQRDESQKTSKGVLASTVPVSESFEDIDEYEKGGLFEGLPKSRRAKKGRGKGKGRAVGKRNYSKQHEREPAVLSLSSSPEPAVERKWPKFKMGMFPSDMDWHIMAYGKDRIIVNPDRLRSRLEKESHKPDKDIRGRFASPEEAAAPKPETGRKKKPATRWGQRGKVAKRTKPRKETPSEGRRKLPVRGANTRHRCS